MKEAIPTDQKMSVDYYGVASMNPTFKLQTDEF